MSLDHGRDFWKRVREDQSFRARVEAATSDQDLSVLLTAEGFALAGDELKASLEEWLAEASASREMSEQELDRVAGGSFGINAGWSVMSVKRGLEAMDEPSFKTR